MQRSVPVFRLPHPWPRTLFCTLCLLPGDPFSSFRHTHAHEAGQSHLRIEYTEALPLQEFYGIIDEHFERRRDLQNASESLNRAAHQYRVVEKRLLSRFKERNPAPLDNLDAVSEETYQRLVELCEGVERAQGRLAVSAARLGCATRLVALLAQYRFQLPCKDHAILLAHLFPEVTDTDEQVIGLLARDNFVEPGETAQSAVLFSQPLGLYVSRSAVFFLSRTIVM